MKGCIRCQMVWQRMISLWMISQVTALPLWNYSVCTNKASNRVFFFFFFLPFYQKKKEIRGLWMLGTCLFLKFYMCHLISVLCNFCKEKTPFYLFFCLIFCGCFMHFIFVGLPALFLTVNKREPFTCFSVLIWPVNYWVLVTIFIGSCFWKM